MIPPISGFEGKQRPAPSGATPRGSAAPVDRVEWSGAVASPASLLPRPSYQKQDGPLATTHDTSPPTPTSPSATPDDARLVSPDTHFPSLEPGTAHMKCRVERPSSYPPRAAVPDDRVSWDVDFDDYRPPFFENPKLVKEDCTQNPEGWADPPDITKARALRTLRDFEPMREGPDKMPLNPRGRTGLCGRGQLGRFGANFAADALVTSVNPDTGKLEMIAIKRGDNGQWAVPGGMVDGDETPAQAAARELREEGGVDLDFTDAPTVFAGYCDDRRNTDNAWMETSVLHLHLDRRPLLLAGDDAADIKWMPITRENVEHLYASHADFVRKAVMEWEARTGHKVSADGEISR